MCFVYGSHREVDNIMLSIFSEETVKKHTKQTEPIEVMGALRNEKDNWKPPKL